MGYYEELSEGSKIHKVRQAYKRRIQNGIRIMPADDSDECIVAFQDIVRHAIKRSSDEGYLVKKHTSSVRSGRPYIAAVLYRD